jgi:Bacterial regulatory helix-turn-helix protein, lysR family
MLGCAARPGNPGVWSAGKGGTIRDAVDCERVAIGARRQAPPHRADVLPEVNSRQLGAVLAVVEYRSFIAAAAHLGISQPALTLTIKRLEQSLGLPLFLRSTRHVTTTAAGREFVAMAERVLGDLRLGMRSLREPSNNAGKSS